MRVREVRKTDEKNLLSKSVFVCVRACVSHIQLASQHRGKSNE